MINRRSIGIRVVFVDVRAFATKRSGNGELGEGSKS